MYGTSKYVCSTSKNVVQECVVYKQPSWLKAHNIIHVNKSKVIDQNF